MRTFLSLWSSPATWSPCSSGTRVSGGPAGQTFSLDLQYLVGISCSNCLPISSRTSFMVMVAEVTFETVLRFLGFAFALNSPESEEKKLLIFMR